MNTVEELHKMGVKQCMHKITISGCGEDWFFCIKRLHHKGQHKIIICDEAVKEILLDDKKRSERFKKSVKKFNKIEGKKKK